MPKGRRPLPTAVKAARGNPGKRKLNAHEPAFAAAPDTSPPAHVVGDARKLWLANITGIERNGLATVPYLQHLAEWCILGARLIDIRRKIKRQGLLVAGRLGRVANPLLAIERDTHKQWMDESRELGLTPAAASKVKANPPRDAKVQDDFTKMRNDGRDKGAVVARIG